MATATSIRQTLTGFKTILAISDGEGISLEKTQRDGFKNWKDDEQTNLILKGVIVISGAITGGLVISALSDAFRGKAIGFTFKAIIVTAFAALTHDLYRLVKSNSLFIRASRMFDENLKEADVGDGKKLKGKLLVIGNLFKTAVNNGQTPLQPKLVFFLSEDKKNEIRPLLSEIESHFDNLYLLNSIIQ